MSMFFDAVALGFVEGLTEFLPISSTGHLMLAGRLLGVATTEAVKTFEIAIQSGAILAVVALYWRKLLIDRAVAARVLVAFVPTAAVGVFVYPLVKGVLLESATVVLWALFLGGIAILLFERFNRGREVSGETLQTISFSKAFTIGLAQAIAVVPGVSRAGATIVGGLALRIDRKTITEFSFLLAVPTMFAATAFDFLKSAATSSRVDATFLVTGFLTSFVVAIVAIRFFLRYVQTHTFVAFGVYRIALAAAFWLFIL